MTKVVTVPLSYNVPRLMCSQHILCSAPPYCFLPPRQVRERDFGKVSGMEILQENAVYWVRSREKRGAMVPGSDCRAENYRDTQSTQAHLERGWKSVVRVYSHFYTKSSVIILCPHTTGNIAGCHLLSIWHSIPCKINASCSLPRILVQWYRGTESIFPLSSW